MCALWIVLHFGQEHCENSDIHPWCHKPFLTLFFPAMFAGLTKFYLLMTISATSSTTPLPLASSLSLLLGSSISFPNPLSFLTLLPTSSPSSILCKRFPLSPPICSDAQDRMLVHHFLRSPSHQSFSLSVARRFATTFILLLSYHSALLFLWLHDCIALDVQLLLV